MEESVESSQSLKLDDSQETAQESEILESDDMLIYLIISKIYLHFVIVLIFIHVG